MAKKNLLPTFASLFLTVGLLASEQAFSLEYKLVTSLSASDKTAVQNLLDRAESMLPPKLKAAVKTVEVSVKDIEIPTIPGRTKSQVAGVASRGGGIAINKSYLKEIVAGRARATQTPQRQHKNAYDEALATVLHETVHVYDSLNIHSKEESAWIMRCRKDEFTKSQMNKTFPDECAAYRNISQTFSQNPYFLQVAGWVGLDFNGNTHRSPDKYEQQNPQEALAVNMEYFLMDPAFKCRRPSMYRLLKSHFQHEPFAGVNCDNELGYVLPSTSPADPAKFLTIDPARVYQVHYLLADKGEAMMSGWGHAMIRLVICAPGRPVGPDCLLDLDQSVVLSYRAFIDSLNISSWDGLRGKYPSRLFIIPLKQVTDEYAMGELRALESIPLKMSRQEIENFVVRSVEAHWAYDGKYYFISNNCATETLNLLKGSLLKPELVFADIRDLEPMTQRDNINPIGLKQTLVSLGLADISVLQDRAFAMKKGFYFDSFYDRFTRVFKVVQDELHVSAPTFKEYLEYSAAQRRDIITRIDVTNPLRFKQAAALMVFENAAARKLETRIKAQIQKVVVEEINASKASGKAGKAGAIAKDFLAISQLFATPSNFLIGQDGYGLPMSQEVQSAKQNIQLQGDKSVKISTDAKALADSLISPADAREIELTASNLESIKAIVRTGAKQLGLMKK